MNEQDETAKAKQVRKAALLDEYRAGSARADQHWAEYQETGSDRAFNNYLAVNRSLSAIYTELVDHGMTLSTVQAACAKKSE